MGVLDVSPLAGIRSRFTVKLVLLLLIVGILVGGIGGLIYVQTGDALEDDTERNLQQTAQLQAETIYEGVAANQRQTALIAQSSAVRSGDPETIRSFFDQQLDTMDDSVAAIHLVDRQGGVISVSTADGIDRDVSGEPWMQLDYQPRRPQMIGPFEDEALDTTAGAITMDLDENTRIVVLLDMVALSERLNDVTDEDAANLHVITEEGIVVMSGDSGRIGKVDEQHLASDDFAQAAGYVEMDLGEEPIRTDEGYAAFADREDAERVSRNRGLGGTVHEVEGDDGTTYYAPGSSPSAYRDSLEAINPLLLSADTVDWSGTDGVMSMGYARVPGADWYVMAHEERSEAFALQSTVSRSVLGLILVSVLGLGLIGVVVGRNTSRSLRDLAERAAELESGNLDAELETRRRDEIGQLYHAFDTMRDSLKDSLEAVEDERERAEARGEELAQLADHLQTKAESFSEVMAAAAAGDLTARLDETSENDAMEEIAAEYNEMMREIEATTVELKRFADEVASHSEEVTASTEEVQSASQRVTESVQGISTRTDEQHGTFGTVLDRMEGLSATTEEIASLASEVSEIAERTATAGDEGRDAAADAVSALNAIDDDAESAVAEIEQLQSQIVEIEAITDSIQQVAKQTNMLALNANIEASRSGAGDEGFSAVAEEVKELATDVQDSAAEIDELVEEIGAQTDRTADEVRRTREEVARNADAVADAIDALDEIADHADDTRDGTREISAASQQQTAAIENVIELVDEAEALSEQVADEAATAAAAAEEQTTAISQVTESASELAGRAGTLQERLDEFETSAPETTPAPAED
ncbi:methyl-accepting chemotaxis protein [Halovivax limisalsi]|uniref:methyl-accepting chemotaxis protein n=1 Tax=Halovivax limisalsi TaxID=1453760 RepID=UPI001FFD8345|nr:methyl-accepting chemotaxis protein [Halovivax limisalsi]